jgi:hypothetical protein
LPDSSTSSTGPINLDKAAKIDAGSSGSVATSRKLLQREGFTRGYIRGWGNIDGDAMLEFVYEWKSPADARRYARGAAVAAKSRPKYHAERSPVAGGYALTYFDKYTFHSVSFAVGRRTFLVNFGVQQAGDALAPLAATARTLDRKAIATGA